MFSPWTYNVDRVAAALLERHGWSRPDAQAFPTGRELAERYLDPLAATPEIAPRLRLGTRVVGIARTGLGKVRTRGREGAAFEIRSEEHTSELQSLMRTSYAVFCLKKKKKTDSKHRQQLPLTPHQ